MPRIKIALPQNFSFSTTIPIRITDVNYGGHVGNDTVLSLIHEARMQFLKSHHYTELDFAGTSLIMSDVAIEFKNELFYDDVLTAFVGADGFTRVGFDLYYKLTKIVNGIETIVATSKTGMICFDYKHRKVVPVPAGVKEKISQ